MDQFCREIGKTRRLRRGESQDSSVRKSHPIFFFHVLCCLGWDSTQSSVFPSESSTFTLESQQEDIEERRTHLSLRSLHPKQSSITTSWLKEQYLSFSHFFYTPPLIPYCRVHSSLLTSFINAEYLWSTLSPFNTSLRFDKFITILSLTSALRANTFPNSPFSQPIWHARISYSLTPNCFTHILSSISYGSHALSTSTAFTLSSY